ncbi:hypothetical protein LEP1GSC061_1937 [Leptospira wolffii serovar Khorat str. Khorat-H2]|nr:hypothetical protein LEP1GSC061_1937 [Leptospira wolffii serovar Khorat str. Khorat-H2]
MSVPTQNRIPFRNNTGKSQRERILLSLLSHKTNLSLADI